ncbi:MAG: adenylate/guanylate cyclase domain-containing protein, partial [Gammaproteobacteria bacterium]
MAEQGARRKLTAILSADAVGYSRLMAANEAATVETLKSYRDIIARLVVRHGGRVVNAPGDALLAEFPSAVEAVQAGVEVQKSLEGHNIELEPERRMQFRIGVNLGDVIEETDGTIYGDGVNIAARMEALADGGGICISSTVFDAVEGKLSFGFDFLGEQQVKNISRPIKVYRVRAEPRPLATPRRSMRRLRWQIVIPALALIAALGAVGAWRYSDFWTPAQISADIRATPKFPQEPSIAVLPFQNMSGNAGEDWFTDGMTETLITDLSRLKNLFVIARNSSFAYKGKQVDVRQVGRELGVRYILEGSVQRTRERLRINAQLVEVQTGRHLWAERYDRRLDDVFDVQDDIAQNIMTELQVSLLAGEQARAWRKTTRNREAYELFLKGKEHHERFTREDVVRAQALLQQALALDPKFAMAMVWLGWTHYIQGDSGWSADSRQSYL